jgi:hypothetical protein
MSLIRRELIMVRNLRSWARHVILIVATLGFAVLSLGAHEPGEEPSGDQDFLFGKDGEVNIKSNIVIGDVLMQKGKYRVEHRVEGAAHSFLFVRISGEKSTKVTEKPIVINSKAAFSGNKTSRSTIHVKAEKNGSNRVTSIAVSPENMEHTF